MHRAELGSELVEDVKAFHRVLCDGRVIDDALQAIDRVLSRRVPDPQNAAGIE
jgi:hypothetical protein